MRAVGAELPASGEKELVHRPLPVLEHGVVLRDFTARVVRVPAADFERDDEVEGGEVEVEPGVAFIPLVSEALA